ncbi:MAG: ferritin family protein [Desulfobacterales bacterium]|nr:ferritin family protein [Desulfobacterales bacterium]
MAYDFNLDDVFHMAVRIEENGAAFYRKAAQTRTDPGERIFLEELARVEDQHKRMFEAMHKKIAENAKAPTAFDPEEENTAYLKAMADSHDGEGSPAVSDFFNGRETLETIVSTAVELEKKSILFYIGLKELVPARYGGDEINAIIKEEQQHVVQLKNVLKRTPA